MLDLIRSSSAGRRFFQAIVFISLAGGAALAAQDGVFGGFIALMLIGGLITGLLSIALQAIAHRSLDQTVVDRFEGDNIGNVINVNRIRIAGIGGLGMVAVAIAMAAVIPAVRLSLALGLVGGFLLALVLISYRKAHAGRWS